MTERIYYIEPYRTEFDALVIDLERLEGRSVAVLDRTAFYPTSGGQPFDTGALGDARVVEVVEREDGTIGHLVEGTLAPGQTVRGRIDWARRFDHMQQHTGQHLLSAAFDRLQGVRTVSFHLGSAASTIDLERDVPPEAIASAEAEANRIVWEDRPVAIRFASEEEAARLPLRKEPGRRGRLRLIEVEGFDLSACGGTHVARTGAVGIVVVTTSERVRGGTRVEFLCGGRALAAFRAQRDVIAAAARRLSVLPAELPDVIDRLQAEARELKHGLRAAEERLSEHKAAALAARATRAGAASVVVDAVECADAAALKSLALALAARPGFAVALCSALAPALVVVARSRDVAVDASAVVRAVTQRFGGRGGGKPDLAQAGGLAGTSSEILDFARDQIVAALTVQG